MCKTLKHRYSSPRILLVTEVMMELSFMAGSVVQPTSQINVVGQSIQEDGYIDSSTDATFNHTWE